MAITLASLDLSLTSTGGIIFHDDVIVDAQIFKTTGVHGTDVQRGLRAGKLIRRWLEDNGGVETIAIESYAYSKFTNVSRLGEYGGMVKYQLQRAGYDLRLHPEGNVMLVASNSAKKFITGNGRASKRQMVQAAGPFLVDFPAAIQSSEDVCDAVAIGKFALNELRKITL